MTDHPRVVSKDLMAAWQRATGDSDPIAALVASRSLYQRLSQWQASLVAEALGAGATWEDIGEALATSRQAVARFRGAVDVGGKPMVEDEAARLRGESAEELKALQEKLRDRDQQWRSKRHDVQAQSATLRDRLRTMDRQRSEDRRALQNEIREEKKALRDRLDALKR